MKIRHLELEIPSDDPFKHCKLNRSIYAEALTTIIETYSKGFVLAINNPWGTGKTTFVRMWQAYLINKGFKTLYFNAWENDFENNPLVPLLSELKSLCTNNNSSTFKSLVQKGALITQNILPSIVKAVAEKYIDTSIIAETIEGVTKSATDILKDEIDGFANKKQSLVEFRQELEKYLRENNAEAPIVFVIDELDRCKPDYSVEVLEQIKHFFNVPGIVFVLAIDKEQLGYAIKGAYNSENLDTREYLRRFIDLEYSIPVPSHDQFTKYLFDYFDFNHFFSNPERLRHSIFRDEATGFIKFSALLFRNINATLRQQEKLFSNARVVLNGFNSNNFVFPSLFIFLLYLKEFYNDFYIELVTTQIHPHEIPSRLSRFFQYLLGDSSIRSFEYTEAILLHLYYNQYREIDYKCKLIERDKENNEDVLLVKSALDGKSSDNRLLELLVHFQRENYDSLRLKYLTDRIDLLAVSKG